MRRADGFGVLASPCTLFLKGAKETTRSAVFRLRLGEGEAELSSIPGGESNYLGTEFRMGGESSYPGTEFCPPEEKADTPELGSALG